MGEAAFSEGLPACRGVIISGFVEHTVSVATSSENIHSTPECGRHLAAYPLWTSAFEFCALGFALPVSPFFPLSLPSFFSSSPSSTCISSFSVFWIGFWDRIACSLSWFLTCYVAKVGLCFLNRKSIQYLLILFVLYYICFFIVGGAHTHSCHGHIGWSQQITHSS